MPPTYRLPPVVVIPPEDASVVIPPTLKFPPTFKFFSMPTPPLATIEPVSLSIDSVALFTKRSSFICVVPALESKIRFPVVVLIVSVSSLILSNVPTPVTFKLLIVAIPVTFKSLTLAIPVTFKFKVVVTPITVKFLVVVSPPTPNVAIVAIPVTFKLIKFVISISISVTVKIPTKPVVAVTNPTEVIPVILVRPPLLPIVRLPVVVSMVLSSVIPS